MNGFGSKLKPAATYSSLAAFIAHYRALQTSPSLSEPESHLLSTLEAILDQVPSVERRALTAREGGDGARRYHRERAARALEAILKSREMLAP